MSFIRSFFRNTIGAAVKGLTFAALGFVIFSPATLPAQGIDEALYTVGTSWTENGESAAYLLWESVDRASTDARSFAIYYKPGEPDAVATYVRAGVSAYQTGRYAIEGILDRARIVGEDTDLLELRVNDIFGEILASSGDISLGEKLSNILFLAQGDDTIYEQLLLLARAHPGVAMAMGRAFALDLEPDLYTFEVREVDPETDAEGGVVGRVTIEVGAPRTLPAPEAPRALVDSTARGHLNVRLLWGVPDPLRRLRLHQYGYNVYRIEKSFAELQGYDAAAPSPEMVEMLANTADEVVGVNRLPIVPDALLTDAEAAALASDPDQHENFFFADANGRHHGGDQFPNGGETFVEGSQYYYFVAARDILGRPGALSSGRLVTVCDRMPSPAPLNVQVANTYAYDEGTDTRTQALKISWEPPKGDHSDDVSAYFVYRFRSIDDIQTATAADFQTPGALVGGPISAVADLEFTDTGLSDGTHYGETWFYTVRAIDDSPCQGNLSGHSAPAYGVLRDREGPDQPGLSVLITEGTLFFVDEGDEGPDTAIVSVDETTLTEPLYRFVCERRNPAVEWAEFLIGGNTIGRVYFGDSNTVTLLTPDFTFGKDASRNFACRIGGAGYESVLSSSYFRATPPQLNSGQAFQIGFIADATFASTPATGPGSSHISSDPATGEINCPELLLSLTPDTKEYKVYRRIDGGRDVLIGQGTQEAVIFRPFEGEGEGEGEGEALGGQDTGDGDINPLAFFRDCSMPATGAALCYFVQAFDEHGNPSVISETVCFQSQPTQPLPVPMLSRIEPVEDVGAKARLEWFCSPYGVERFEILIAPVGQLKNPAGDDLSGNLSSDQSGITVPGLGDESFAVAQTGRVEGNFPAVDGGSQFSVDLNVVEGVRYRIAVRAVGEGSFDQRSTGGVSNLREFAWSAPTATPPEPEVPWPERGVPNVEPNGSRISARLFIQQGAYQGVLPDYSVGIQVGEYEFRNRGDPVVYDTLQAPYIIPGDDPHSYLFRSYDVSSSEGTDETEYSPLPCVLYRYQVPSEDFPNPSGAVVQVSPLIREIAWERDYGGFDGSFNAIHDNFLRAWQLESSLSSGATHGIYILDTQPILAGASYRYLLIRFGPDGEIDRIIPTRTILITSPSS
jgi:hypothetical protein